MRKIPEPRPPKRITNLEYFTNLAARPALPLLKSPCHDCAVVCGFYQQPSDALKALKDREIKEKAAKSWFCHEHPKMACRGNWDNVFS